MTTVTSDIDIKYISEVNFDLSSRELQIEGFVNPDDDMTYKVFTFQDVHNFHVHYTNFEEFDPEVLEYINYVEHLKTSARFAFKIITDCTVITVEASELSIDQED